MSVGRTTNGVRNTAQRVASLPSTASTAAPAARVPVPAPGFLLRLVVAVPLLLVLPPILGCVTAAVVAALLLLAVRNAGHVSDFRRVACLSSHTRSLDRKAVGSRAPSQASGHSLACWRRKAGGTDQAQRSASMHNTRACIPHGARKRSAATRASPRRKRAAHARLPVPARHWAAPLRPTATSRWRLPRRRLLRPAWVNFL